MKRLWTVGLLVAGLAFAANAQDTASDWVTKHSNDKVSELTVGDLAELAKAESVTWQQKHYIFRAGVSSFLLPGVGQLQTGDVTGGVLQLVGHAALVGATLYTTWALLPSDLQKWNLSMHDRHALWESYWTSDPGRIAPALGVMAGGAVLSLVQSVWAAHDARSRAVDNVQSGKVTFEPLDMGAGFGMRMRY